MIAAAGGRARMIAAVVPVKGAQASKSRLHPALGVEGARRLALAMLEDVVEALLDTPCLARVAVVTPDAEVAGVASKAGALALVRDDPGLNSAVEAASAELAPGAGDGVLVVLGDVAGVRAEDVEALVAAAPVPGVVLAPSNDGGTAALLRVPRDVIPAGFGAGSARRHRRLAEERGVALRELSLPSLALDLDDASDLRAFLACEAAAGGGRRTRALLRELLGAGAPGSR
jgi:2-phospho-L-lactate guanylyltransferase